MVKVTDADVKRATDWLAIPIDTPARRSERDRLAVRFARHRIAGVKAGLEAAAKEARDCAVYDQNMQLLHTDIRATCATAIRNINPEECE